MAKRNRQACKLCESQRVANWRANNRQKNVLSGAKYRATRLGVPFDLTPEDIDIPTHCPVLGIRLVFGRGNGGRASSPSIDRLDPDLGYVRGNVRIISHKANTIKSNATLPEVEAVAQYMRDNNL